MRPHNLDFRSGVVRAGAFLGEAWQLVRDDYWILVGIVFLAQLLGSAAPLGILYGPAICGIHICLLRRERGHSIGFEHFFDGFHFFGPSVVATLIILVPEVILVLMSYVITIGGTVAFFGGRAANPGAAQPPDPSIGIAIALGAGVALLLLIAAAIVLEALVLFTYPLIVDKELSGWDAIKLSCRAAWANFGGIIGMLLLRLVIDVGVSMVLCVGPILWMPIHIAMAMVAYRHVFTDDMQRYGERDFDEAEEDAPRVLPAPSEGITEKPLPPGSITT
ncbi:MAG TPA: hypothetical protein VFE62_19670 [Gemmataceae bacterium]|nr:hypothetical protein [Gemmataceae bacterium]